MKKDEVKIGHCYTAKVSDKLVTVRIDGTHSRTGWNATNTVTGKRIHVKSAQRLRGLAGDAATTEAGDGVAPAAAETPTKASTKTTKAAKSTAAGARPKPVKKPKAEPKPKRVSALDAAAQVLAKAGKPMRAQDLITEMAAKGLWTSPGGKTPHATLYAAMMREANNKGKDARFTKTDRGLFAFNG